MPFDIRPATAADRGDVDSILQTSWGGTTVVARGRAHDVATLPTLVATDGAELVGMASYDVRDGECELVTLDALHHRRGIGTALLQRVIGFARDADCRRVWLITTNDNLDALRFYLANGLRLVAVHRDAVTEARQLKPSIPTHSPDGIPIRDEWELELPLT